MTLTDETIKLVEILRPKPDDVIVLTVANGCYVNQEAIAGIKQNWKSATGLANRVVVLSDLEVRIVRPEEVAAA